MKKLNIYFIIITFLTVIACTDDFQEINTNPNAPVDIQPELVLRQVIYDYGEQMSYEGFVAGNLLGQYMTAIDFNLFDRHGLKNPQLGGNPWSIIYKNLLDNEQLLKIAQSSETFAVYEGPALILKAYMTAALTDMFGNVPYSEALNGLEGNVTPKFDEQEAIYLGENGILDNLKNGIAAIENYQGNLALSGDILFEGNLNHWIQFANSLRIKSLMRISDRVDIQDELQSIYAESNYIKSNAENATFDFTDGRPNNFRMATLREGDYNLFIMSKTMQEILEKYEEPKANVLFRPAANSGEFAGLRNGPDASQISISVADYSLSGSIFRSNTSLLDANFMTAWETNFLLAEAAHKGFISADAKTLYETAVTQAFEYWHTEIPADFLSEGNAAFGENGNDPLQQIIEQKWLANIINGYEGWVEWKRTGFPELKSVTASLNNGLIPVRMPYPSSEVTLNQEQLVETSGNPENSINQSVWWDID
jgi:hypothetical protein